MSAAPGWKTADDHDARSQRSLTGLFADLLRETGGLVRAEIALARVELTQKAGQAAGGMGLVAAGGAIAFLGAIFLLAAATLGLMRVVEPWQAALIVGGITALVGVAVLLLGRSRLRARALQPERTLETLRENKRWAESQLGR